MTAVNHCETLSVRHESRASVADFGDLTKQLIHTIEEGHVGCGPVVVLSWRYILFEVDMLRLERWLLVIKRERCEPYS